MEGMVCAVCSMMYKRGSHEPLILPCGYSFCRSCVVNFIATGELLCLSCKKFHRNVNVERLLINYSLLSFMSSFKEIMYDLCGKHGDELRYWCVQCRVELCGVCLYSEHPNNHPVQLAMTYVKEKKSELKDYIKSRIDKIGDEKAEIKSKFYNSCQKMRMQCLRGTQLYDLERNTKGLLTEIEKISKVRCMLVFEEKVKIIDTESEFKYLSVLSGSDSKVEVNKEHAGSNGVEVGGGPGAVEAGAARAVEAEAATAVEAGTTLAVEAGASLAVMTLRVVAATKNNADIAISQQLKPQRGRRVMMVTRSSKRMCKSQSVCSGRCNNSSSTKEGLCSCVSAVTSTLPQYGTHQTVECHHAQLDYRDGKLLLHSLAKSVGNHLFLKMPSEVFLELSVDGRCLGRAYIQLLPCLRRAQQFLLLCLGSLGPSYIGSSIRTVKNEFQDKEYIAVDYYVDQNKGKLKENLLTHLESGDYYKEPVKAGTLAVLIARRTMNTCASVNQTSDTAGFIICTRGEPGGQFRYPIGEVSSGLEVVQAAAGHASTTEVIITDCGLVIPDLTT